MSHWLSTYVINNVIPTQRVTQTGMLEPEGAKINVAETSLTIEEENSRPINDLNTSTQKLPWLTPPVYTTDQLASTPNSKDKERQSLPGLCDSVPAQPWLGTHLHLSPLASLV